MIKNLRQRKRALITGIGAITPFGFGLDVLIDAVLQGSTCISRINDRHLTAGLDVYAAAISSESLLEQGPIGLQSLDRRSRFAVSSAWAALRDAGLPLRGGAIGCCFGGSGGFDIEADAASKAADIKDVKWNPEASFHRAAESIYETLELNGALETYTSACAASAYAIGAAVDQVRHDEAAAVLAGGAASLNALTVASFKALRIYDSVPCRPFDTHRRGVTLGEGACCLVVESEQAAVRRGRQVYAEVVGWSCCQDLYHVTEPDPSGEPIYRAIVAALEDASLSPAEIGYINAHGTGTRANDLAESIAIARLFGDKVLVSSTKGATGHVMEAAGALECAITIGALRAGFVPPNVGLMVQDGKCNIRVINKAFTRIDSRYALSLSAGFGGTIVALILTIP